MTNTQTATIRKPRRLKKFTAERARARQGDLSRGQRDLAKVFSSTDAEVKVLRDGTKERVGDANTARAIYFLKGRRVYDQQEILEFLNRWWMSYMVSSGFAVKRNGFYWITTKCQAAYGLPNRTPDGMKIKFVEND